MKSELSTKVLKSFLMKQFRKCFLNLIIHEKELAFISKI